MRLPQTDIHILVCVCVGDFRVQRRIQMHNRQKDKDLFNVNSAARTTSARWAVGRRSPLTALTHKLANYYTSTMPMPPLKCCASAGWPFLNVLPIFASSHFHIFAFSRLVQFFISMHSRVHLFAAIPVLPASVPVQLALAKLLLFTRSQQVFCFLRFRSPSRTRHVIAKPGKYVRARARP